MVGCSSFKGMERSCTVIGHPSAARSHGSEVIKAPKLGAVMLCVTVCSNNITNTLSYLKLYITLWGRVYSTNFRLFENLFIIIILEILLAAASVSFVCFCLRVTMLRSTTPAPSCPRATRPLRYRQVPSQACNNVSVTSKTKLVPLYTNRDAVRIGVRGHCGTAGYLRSTDAHPMHTGIKDERAHQISVKLAMSNVTPDQFAVWLRGGNGFCCLLSS